MTDSEAAMSAEGISSLPAGMSLKLFDVILPKCTLTRNIKPMRLSPDHGIPLNKPIASVHNTLYCEHASKAYIPETFGVLPCLTFVDVRRKHMPFFSLNHDRSKYTTLLRQSAVHSDSTNADPGSIANMYLPTCPSKSYFLATYMVCTRQNMMTSIYALPALILSRSFMDFHEYFGGRGSHAVRPLLI